MSMFWNPVTGSYQRSCPALSPVQKQPLNDSVKGQPLKQPPDDQVDQPPVVEHQERPQITARNVAVQPQPPSFKIQPRNVARDLPRKQHQNVAKNVDQPQDGVLIESQPLSEGIQSQNQPRTWPQCQPRTQPQSQPQNDLNVSLEHGLKVRPPDILFQNQPPAAEIQPPDLPPDPDPSKLQESQNVSSYW